MASGTTGFPNASGQGNGGLAYALRTLGRAASVLHLGAHPDDEDVGTIAYLARGLGARTVYWSATRGEGSQNRIGPERGEALGVLRTWESLAARELDGGEVLYGPFYDFGFSKTAVDTFARWSRDELVAEIARAIRLVQPLVVISRWNGDERDGHGHHRAVGQAVRDAWELAADPSALTSLGLPAWEPRRLYRSLGGDWQPGEDVSPGEIVPEYDEAGYLRLDTGQVDLLSGRTFQELGHLALNQHRTQGMAFAPERGSYYLYYRRELDLTGFEGTERDFFDGLETRLRGLAAYPGGADSELWERLATIDAAVDAAAEAFRPGRTRPSGEALLDGLAALSELREGLGNLVVDEQALAALDLYLGRKEQDVGTVAARCLGLTLECLLDRHLATPGARLPVTSQVWSDGTVEAKVATIRLELPEQWSAKELRQAASQDGASASTAVRHEVHVAEHRWTASPYWLRTPRRPYRYAWPSTGAESLPLDPPLLTACATLEVDGRRLELRVPAQHRRAVPGGVGLLPLNVLPPIELTSRYRRLLLPAHGATSLQLPVRVRCLRDDGRAATVGLACPAGWAVEPAAVEIETAVARAERTLDFRVAVPEGAPVGTHTLRYLVVSDGPPYGVELEPVRLGLGPGPANAETCVAETFVTRPSALDIHLVDVEFVADHRYAYVPGLADDIVSSLERFGLDMTILPGEQLAFADLGAYDAVVIGPNAYNADPAVRACAQRLLDYAADGGTLVVQHQTYGYDEPGLAPYPFSYNQPHDRVTVPDAPVEAVAPDQPVLNLPNRLASSDWEGWVHDRGIYFFGTWDPRYLPILSATDPGEEPRLGGLMVASHGRGVYVYCGYSFARQIPAGVAGAIRLFANVLGLAESRMRERARCLRAEALLDFLTDAEVAVAARWVSERSVEAGAELACQGTGAAGIYIGADVELELWHADRDGERLVRVAAPGEPVGSFDALRDGPPSVTVRGRDAGRVLELRGDVLRGWLCADRDLAGRLVGRLAEEIARQR